MIDQRTDPAKTYQTWIKRIKDSESKRLPYENKLWRPLLDQISGPRIASVHANDIEDQITTRHQQYVDTVMPHLVGDQRQAIVSATRIRPGEDAAAKQAHAELMGDQATALGRAIGIETDPLGKPGIREQAIFNSLWSVGIVIIGFELPRGLKQATIETGDGPESVESDQDFAWAQNHEYADAGMPTARVIDPRHFVGDWTYGDFGRGLWFAETIYLNLVDARARWPKHARNMKPTHATIPTWQEDSEGNKARDETGVAKFYVVYQRNPARYFVLASDDVGPQEILESNPYDLGIEELPILLLGHQWLPGTPYPKPPLANLHGSAVEEEDCAATLFAAGRKIKSMTIVNAQADKALANKLRDGDANGVYETDAADLDRLLKNMDVGAIRRELLDLRALAAEETERSSGISDLMLGLREPGNPTQIQTATRQQAIAARQARLVKPARDWEALLYMRLIACAYAKLSLMHGLQIPLDDGAEQSLIAFDQSRPLIGQMIDYTFRVETADRFTAADQAQIIRDALATVMDPNITAKLNAQGRDVNIVPLIESLITKTNVPRGGELLIPYQPPMPPIDPMTGMPVDASMQAAPQMPPPAAPPEPSIDELYAQLAQIPEGDPAEEMILRQIAALQPVAA